MTELVSLIAKFGLWTVIPAALLLILLRGEINFRYPRDPDSKRARYSRKRLPYDETK